LDAQEPKDDLQKLVIPLDEPSSAVKAARERLAAGLADVKPEAKAQQRSLIAKDGRFILYGDLFKTGGCFALFESPVKSEDEPQYNNGTIALAEWTKSKWQLRGLWNIPAVWRPKGWKWDGVDGDNYLPVIPATHPFELRDLSGDGVPEVLIAGEVEKYFQAYYLLRFEPKTRGLILLASAMGKPERAGKYVRLYFNSGRRAIYEAWEYLQWSGEKLVTKALWHDESPYNNIDPHFVRADVTGDDGGVRSFKITDAESNSENESAYTITKDNMPYASLVVVWHKSRIKKPVDNADEVELAWLFEKITGLPRELVPRRRDIKRLARLEDHATVRVTGSEEALRKLSSDRRR